jgi:hypothetical protein
VDDYYQNCLYFIGCDLGQVRDYTALCVVEEQLFIHPDWNLLYRDDLERGLRPGWISPAALAPGQVEQAIWHAAHVGRPASVPLQIKHLERFELGLSYTDLAAKVAARVRAEPLRWMPKALVVDKTGVGASVLDTFRAVGLGAIAITFTGGETVSRDPQTGGYRVPTKDLITSAQLPVQNGLVKVAPSLPEGATLQRELLHFKVKQNKRTGNERYEAWREGDHDDLVYATAMSTWFRRHAKVRTDTVLARRLRQTSAAMGVGAM